MRAALLTSLLFASVANAQTGLSNWLNPGPLSQSHVSLEGVLSCTKCHAAGSGIPDSQCLKCHKEIGVPLQAKQGWHVRQTKECHDCHFEHKGRTADVTGLSRLPFDHADTGWLLAGGHIKVKCDSCHKELRTDVVTKKKTTRTTYLEARSECGQCHADPHRADRAEFKKCSLCHTDVTWRDAPAKSLFDHDKQTKYALTGAHNAVDCYKCHKLKTWRPLEFPQCTPCHADPHKGKLGPNCEKCHSTTVWTKGTTKGGKKKAAFDHDKTRFPLTGTHRDVSCQRCHGAVIGKIAKFKICGDCHNNPHGDEFTKLWAVKKSCPDCHVTDGWKILSFRHDVDSRYKLEGEHERVACEQCHVDRKYRWLAGAPDCDVCHSDVHQGQFTKACASCHKYQSFSKLLFDHNRESPFPLAGKHADVSCVKCHEGGKFKPIDHRCQDCHNDFHNNELGIECTRCHAPSAFNSIEFNHDRESRFKLAGKHTILPCNKCHLDYKYKIGPTLTCNDCHFDPHKGKEGKKCEKCHTADTWFLEKR